jgi:adenylate kinase family enzyme
MIIGCGGSGKSTLSKRLYDITNIPVYHLDQYFWLPNWTEIDRTEWQKVNQEIIQKESWIMDGNYGSTMDMRLEVADTVIFMNRPWYVSLSRVIMRTLKSYGKTRVDMPENCPERFSWHFLHYIMMYNKTRRPSILKKLAALSKSTSVYILKTDKDIEEFVATI